MTFKLITLGILISFAILYFVKGIKNWCKDIVFASKKSSEQRNLIINSPPGTAFYLDLSNFALNPLQPIDNTNYENVLADLARVLATELGLMVGGELYLQKCLFEFMAKNNEVTFIDFIKWMANRKEYSLDYRGYRDRLVVRLEAMKYEIGGIFNCYSGISDSCFVEENLVIEVPTSTPIMMSLVSALILSRMLRFKANNPQYIEQKNLIVLEDIQESLRYEF